MPDAHRAHRSRGIGVPTALDSGIGSARSRTRSMVDRTWPVCWVVRISRSSATWSGDTCHRPSRQVALPPAASTAAARTACSTSRSDQAALDSRLFGTGGRDTTQCPSAVVIDFICSTSSPAVAPTMASWNVSGPAYQH